MKIFKYGVHFGSLNRPRSIGICAAVASLWNPFKDWFEIRKLGRFYALTLPGVTFQWIKNRKSPEPPPKESLRNGGEKSYIKRKYQI